MTRMTGPRCDHCPIAAAYECPGENAAVLCRTHASRPDYAAVLWAHARPRADVERERLGVAEAASLLGLVAPLPVSRHRPRLRMLGRPLRPPGRGARLPYRLYRLRAEIRLMAEMTEDTAAEPLPPPIEPTADELVQAALAEAAQQRMWFARSRRSFSSARTTPIRPAASSSPTT